MNQVTKLTLLFAIFSVFFTSCLINKDFMFKTPEDFAFETPKMDTTNKEYRIAINSIISIQVLSRNGSAIIESTSGSDGASNSRIMNQNVGGLNYVVDQNGEVDLPLIGKQKIVDKTIFEAQNYLEKVYEQYINDPYCIIRVNNRRFMYFNGNGSTGTLVELGQDNASILEAIVRGGGISARGNSSKVKVIRTINGKQQVFLFDMSTISAMQYVNFSIQSGDIVYVEPMPQYSSELLSIITPALTLFSTILLYFSLVQ
jgi:polysaccharide export outer membrane protein